MPIPPPSPRIRAKEADGSPNVRAHTIIVSNGSLTDNGDGTVTLTISTTGSAWSVLTDSSAVPPELVWTASGDVVMVEELR